MQRQSIYSFSRLLILFILLSLGGMAWGQTIDKLSPAMPDPLPSWLMDKEIASVNKGRSATAVLIDDQLALLLQDVLDSVRVSRNWRGMTAAVTDSAGNVWLGTSGYSVEATCDTITSDMVFNIGSVTKTFIGALTLQLVEEGHFSLNDSIYHWIPPHPNIDSTVTIRQLLNHTSGINDFLNTDTTWAVAVFADPDSLWPPQDVLDTFVGSPDYVKGSQWGYSNTNYIILGMIIEQTTGLPAAEALKVRAYDSAGLSSMFLAPDDSITTSRAHNWQDITGTGVFADYYDFPVEALYSIPWTAGTIFGTAEELVYWSDALFRGNIVSQNLFSQMVSPQWPSTFYGLGITVAPVFGRTVWGHGGSYIGYRTAMFYSNQDKISIAVIVNQNPADVDFAYLDLFDAILSYVPTSIETSTPPTVADSPVLEQNYPNPFNPLTTISFQVSSGPATLSVYNILGQRVRVLFDEAKARGTYEVTWEGLDAAGAPVASGVYFYELQTDQHSLVRKMMLIR